MSRNNPKRPASQRQLKVGELLRHALAEIFLREPLYEPGLAGVSVTVAEVKVSPDLRNATAYVSPMGHTSEEDFLEGLKRASSVLRAMVTKRVQLRYSPQIIFRIDKTFDYASRIDQLLRENDVPIGSDAELEEGAVPADE